MELTNWVEKNKEQFGLLTTFLSDFRRPLHTRFTCVSCFQTFLNHFSDVVPTCWKTQFRRGLTAP